MFESFFSLLYFVFFEWNFSHSLNWKGIIDAKLLLLVVTTMFARFKSSMWIKAVKKKHRTIYGGMCGNEENDVTFQWIGKKFVLGVVEKKKRKQTNCKWWDKVVNFTEYLVFFSRFVSYDCSPEKGSKVIQAKNIDGSLNSIEWEIFGLNFLFLFFFCHLFRNWIEICGCYIHIITLSVFVIEISLIRFCVKGRKWNKKNERDRERKGEKTYWGK